MNLMHCKSQLRQSEQNNWTLESDNRFTPHITIAKKRKINGEFPIQKETSTPIQFHVDRFSLFRIHPSKSPKYEAIETFQYK